MTSALLVKRLCEQLTPTWINEGDLFEVFLTLEALWKHDPLHVSGEHLAQAIQRLVQSEIQVGGPYISGGFTDIAANLQIASFVQKIAKPLPGLNAFFDQIISTKQFKDAALHSPYILDLFVTLYDRPALKPQQKLLTICKHQLPTGFWPAKVLLHGQSASCVATTALTVKSLIACQIDKTPGNIPSDVRQQHKLVVEATQQLFNTHAEPLRQSALSAIDKICHVQKTFEITLLSYFFTRGLKLPTSLTDQQIALLGAANVCGWVAYDIYDDFLDDEGTASQLPLANVMMRASLDCFRSALPGNPAFERYVANVFNEMDQANAREANNCRFMVRGDTITIDQLPVYGRRSRIAAQSFAHALGPMAILAEQGGITRQQTRYIESAFRNYLIARQLSDDLHDWMGDIQAGQASYVVVAILRDLHLRSGAYALPILLPRMQKQFRRTTMPQICLVALRHIDQAKQDFIKSDLLQPTNGIDALIDELELSLRRSFDQHAKASALLDSASTWVQ